MPMQLADLSADSILTLPSSHEQCMTELDIKCPIAYIRALRNACSERPLAVPR